MQVENLTPSMQRVLKLAEIEASREKDYIGSVHVLIGILLEGSNGADSLLKQAGITVESLREFQYPWLVKRASS